MKSRTNPVATILPAKLSHLLWLFARAYPYGTAALFALPLASRAVFASIAYATKQITDAVLAVKDGTAANTGAIYDALLLFALVIGASIIIDWLTWTFSYFTRTPMLAAFRKTAFAFVQRHPVPYFDNILSGKVAHKTLLIAEQGMDIFGRLWFDLVPAAGFFIMVMLFFFTAAPVFAGMALVWLLIYFATCLFMGRTCLDLAALHNDAKTQITGKIVDAFSNIRNIITFAAHDREDRHVGVSVDNAFLRQRALYLSYVRMRVAQQALNLLMWGGLYGGAIYYWLQGLISVGDFVMITTLTGLMITKAYEIGQMLPEVFDLFGSATESLETITDAPTLPDIPNAPKLQLKHGTIDFENLSFSYDKRGAVLSDLTLHIKAGERIGLVGPSGAGKTTITTLLMRLYDPQQGRILLDGQDIARVTQTSLRQQIAVIAQETQLFHRSLIDNIRFGQEEATEEAVITAAKAAYAHEFIMQLPAGYQTMVGERGVKLSGGQRQRIAIARALLKNSPILLLDEATSALDSESEEVIQAAMKNAMQGKTVIAIAHRLSTIMHLDRLIVLANGRVQEQGSHHELLAKNGLYAQLWARQSGGFIGE